jgi:hypothetical protein
MAEESKSEREQKKLIAALENALRVSNMLIEHLKKSKRKSLLDLTHQKN